MNSPHSRTRRSPLRRSATVIAALAAVLISVTVSSVALSSPGDASVPATATAVAKELVNDYNAGKLSFLHPDDYTKEILPLAQNGSISSGCANDIKVLQTIALTAQHFGGVTVNDMQRTCIGESINCSSGSLHCSTPGRAIDFGAIGSPRQTINGSNAATVNLLRYLDTFVPSGTRAGQSNCRSALSLAYITTQFADTCNHQHVDFPTSTGGLRGVSNTAPKGHIDGITSSAAGQLSVRGWAFDPDTSASIKVGIVVDGTRLAAPAAAAARADVNQAYGITGNHGFSTSVAVNPGKHSVQVVAYDSSTGAATSVGTGSVTVAGTKPAASRVSGAVRADTAAAISKANFSSAAVAYVASGADYPDAVSAASVAAKAGGPLLLTDAGSLPASTRSELTRLKPARIVIVGGTAAVSATVASQIKSAVPAATVSRVSGADRYATSRSLVGSVFTGTVPALFVVAGTDWPDGIVANNAAVFNKEPVLMVNGAGGLDAATTALIKKLKPGAIRVVGGTGSVSATTLNALTALQSNTARVAGADRYATAATIADRTYDNPAPSTGAVQAVYLVSGANFPDGLASSMFARGKRSALLYAEATCVPQSTLAEIYKLKATKVVLIGGTAVLNVSSLAPCGV